jgi:hypothetical protein
MAMLAKQGLEISRLNNTISKLPEDMSLRAQCQRLLDDKDKVNAIREGKKVEFELNMRATSPMLPANTYGGSAYLPKIEYQPGIVELVRPMPTFWDYLKKGATNTAAYVWVNKVNPIGAAAFIAPGVYKPGISFAIQTEISNAKKIAANEKMAVELLEDIDGFTSWVEQELYYQVMQNASLQLMNGVGSSTNPAGIKTVSVPFAGAALGVGTTVPNNWDCIKACVTQLRRANFGGAITAFLNPVDYANMLMSKANSQGQLFIPPATGATIVEDNNIAVGFMQVAVLDLYRVLIYKGFTMQWGLENDDFTKNLRTVIGEMRIHQFYSNNHVGAFIYDSFANITPAITIV